MNITSIENHVLVLLFSLHYSKVVLENLEKTENVGTKRENVDTTSHMRYRQLFIH